MMIIIIMLFIWVILVWSDVFGFFLLFGLVCNDCHHKMKWKKKNIFLFFFTTKPEKYLTKKERKPDNEGHKMHPEIIIIIIIFPIDQNQMKTHTHIKCQIQLLLGCFSPSYIHLWLILLVGCCFGCIFVCLIQSINSSWNKILYKCPQHIMDDDDFITQKKFLFSEL